MSCCSFSYYRAKQLWYLAILLFVSGFGLLVFQRKIKNIYIENPSSDKLNTLLTSGTGTTSPTSFSVINRINYNLMEEKIEVEKMAISIEVNDECSLDYMNKNKLPQDHPCVIEIIRQNYLNKPPPLDVPLKLDSYDKMDRSAGQTGIIFRLLKNQTNGFFVECGALNGEYMSNTIDLERKFNWSGILIEANPETYERLLSHNRKSWTLPVCLSLEPFPTQVTYQMKIGDPGHSHIEGSAKTLQTAGIPNIDPELVNVQCFPFYSILLAVGRTQVDFFSLDVEGHELKILKTIPWHKVDIKTLTVEWDHIPEGQIALSKFMVKNGFIRIGAFDFLWTRDVIFMKDLLNSQ